MATVKSRIVGPDGEPIQYEVLDREISAGGMAGIRQVWHTGVAAGLTPPRLAAILTDQTPPAAPDPVAASRRPWWRRFSR